MGRRKVYVRTDLSIPQVEHSFDQQGRVLVLSQAVPPANTLVTFGRNATSVRSFDFARWYGSGIDSITYACQTQIERFLAGQDVEIQVSSITAACRDGLRHFFDCLVLRATALEREMTLADIDRELIDDYLGHLAGQGVTISTQRVRYSGTKCVLLALGRRGLITLVASGDAATFPRNPFPNSGSQQKGETPLSKGQRQAFAAAVKQAVKPIWSDDIALTSHHLAYALLIVALHTGRNTTPLLEMTRDCLRAHPKDNSTFLVLWKRRGHNSNKVVLRADSTHERLLEATPTIKTNVESLIRRVIARTKLLPAEVSDELQPRVWLYRSRAKKRNNLVSALTVNELDRSIQKLVTDYGLLDSDGKPLRLNVSRLRKTFANRIFELLDGDLATTAIALGNSPQVAGRNYLMPDEDAKRNWQFMGEILVEELMSRTIGATCKMIPTGHCSDLLNGQYAPKREGAICMNFLNCVRCRHFAVTGEDLYKLFSFYFRVLRERTRMDKRRWAREYAHIPRLIDNYIVAEGLRRGAFKLAAVEAAKERARTEPHPFWSYDVVSDLGVFA